MLAVFIVAVVLVTDRVHGKDCPIEYARFSDHHSYCLDPEPSCSVAKTGVDDDAKAEILRVHNELRSKVANGEESRAGGLPPAADMLKMVWDDELAEIASGWAHQCQFHHDCGSCRTTEDYYSGQNLAQANSDDCTSDDCVDSVQPDWTEMITLFYEEVNSFDKQYINPYQFVMEWGHFSQVTWAKSWKVGCAFVAYWNGNKITSLYACNYGPGGNGGPAPMYIEGDTCSACPSNTKCGSDGLCEVEDEAVGPVYEEKMGNLLDCNWLAGNTPCDVQIEEKNDWMMKDSVSGNYMTIILNGGEKSVMKMPAPFKPNTDSFCLVVSYRKGPTDASNADSSNVALLLHIPDMDWSPTIPINHPSNDISPMPVDLGWDSETELSIEFSVAEGAPEHIFDIKEIEVYDGKCADRNQ